MPPLLVLPKPTSLPIAMNHPVRLTAFLLVLVFSAFPYAASAQLMIIGNDDKYSFNDAGQVVFGPPGKDTISIVDISNREAPKSRPGSTMI